MRSTRAALLASNQGERLGAMKPREGAEQLEAAEQPEAAE
jgi:hypothetical protein